MPDVCLIKNDTEPEDISTTSESFDGGILPFSAFAQHTKLNEVCGITIVNLVTSLIRVISKHNGSNVSQWFE